MRLYGKVINGKAYILNGSDGVLIIRARLDNVAQGMQWAGRKPLLRELHAFLWGGVVQ